MTRADDVRQRLADIVAGITERSTTEQEDYGRALTRLQGAFGTWIASMSLTDEDQYRRAWQGLQEAYTEYDRAVEALDRALEGEE